MENGHGDLRLALYVARYLRLFRHGIRGPVLDAQSRKITALDLELTALD